MALILTVTGQPGDDAQSLLSWLSQDEDLRGRVQEQPASVPEGKLGALTDVLVAALGPGGTAMALATVAISWLRSRKTSTKLEATRSDGASIIVTSDLVKTTDDLRQLTNKVAEWVDGSGETPPELE
ncbi:effector-associated constant component EACC1 [Actinoplanes rectilineatus]|uniref:effector-associated constant component EACC1 n=1 Tax=Actinoplanes rectilineatus TaxID=113571 RepID=UPI0005F29046|nr:hypothetical protein [Actinoplanes rectilineatus]